MATSRKAKRPGSGKAGYFSKNKVLRKSIKPNLARVHHRKAAHARKKMR